MASGGFLASAAVTVVLLLFALVGVAAAEAVFLGVEHARGHGRYRELWARVGDRRVLLVRTNDAIRFEQIRRALVRALEDHRRRSG